MAEGGDHGGSSLGSFSSFWQKVGIGKGNSAKDVKFMTNVMKPGPGAGNDKVGTETDNLTPKQRRRAQVRKAQIEHRQRKENYVKHLEQDVIKLREMIASATTQAVIFKHENESIKAVLSKSQVPIASPLMPLSPQHQPHPQPQPQLQAQPEILPDVTIEETQRDQYDPLNFSSFNMDFNITPETTSEPAISQSYSLPQSYSPPWNNNPSPTKSNSSVVSTYFDEFINASCLQINPIHAQPNDILTNSSANTPPLQEFSAQIEGEKRLPDLPVAAIRNDMETEFSIIAVNFILALEHPCRTHFHPPAASFDPLAPATGHELMASTILYSSAPNTIFTSPEFTSPSPPTHPLEWEANPLPLSALYDMATSLPKTDWEITPVQAWFKLIARYPELPHILLAPIPTTTNQPRTKTPTILENLKTSLGKIVGCFAFGAVMDETRFWHIVEQELGYP